MSEDVTEIVTVHLIIKTFYLLTMEDKTVGNEQ